MRCPFVGHSRTIIGIEQRASGLTLLVLDPSHGPRQVAALGSSRDSLRLIRRNMAAMRAPQYQIVAVKGLFDTEEQFQVIPNRLVPCCRDSHREHFLGNNFVQFISL